MNVAEVRQLADQMRQAAERLRTVVSTIDGRVSHSSWEGRDADGFRHQWWPAQRSHLLGAAEQLQGLARSAGNNADEQERVSGPAVGSSWSPTAALGGLDGIAAGIVRFADESGMKAAGLLMGTLGLPGVLALARSGYTPKTWAGYYGRIVNGSVAGKLHLQGPLSRLTPLFRAADRTPFFDLRNSEVTNWLRSPGKVQDLVNIGDDVKLDRLGRVVGVVGIVEEGTKAYQAARSGDYVGAGLHGADAVAATAKASKNPILFLGGVGVDAVTDVVDIARGKTSWKDWRPWSLL